MAIKLISAGYTHHEAKRIEETGDFRVTRIIHVDTGTSYEPPFDFDAIEILPGDVEIHFH